MKNSVFIETLKIENGLIYNLNLHQERMQKTAFFHYKTKPTLKIDISAIPPYLHGKIIKCRVLYSSDVMATEFYAYEFRKIKLLQIVEDNNIKYEHKSADRNNFNKLLEQKKEADDIIIVKNGNITDSSFSNLIFESSDGKLFTPKTYLLAGIKRRYLLETNIIKEQQITINNFHTYKKVYLINAMIDIEDNVSIPISSIQTPQ